MKSVALNQTVGLTGAMGIIAASVGVQKDCPLMIRPVTPPPRIQFLDRRFDDFQWIAATALPNVQVDCRTGLIGQTLEQCRVPPFALTFTGHEKAAAL